MAARLLHSQPSRTSAHRVHPIEARAPEAALEAAPKDAARLGFIESMPVIGTHGGAANVPLLEGRWTEFNRFLPEWQEHCLCPTSRLLPMPLAASSPAVHTGFIRAVPASVDNVEPAEYQEVSILVDSGSQQAPLCSTAVAERLGASGKLTSFALQAGGQPLPAYLRCGLV